MPNNAMPYDNTQSPAIPNQQKPSGAEPSAKRQPNAHPNQLDKGAGVKQAFENEGEGSRSAARNYDQATEQYIESGRVAGAAKAAEDALEGEEGDELREAERRARAQGAGDAPRTSSQAQGETTKPDRGKAR